MTPRGERGLITRLLVAQLLVVVLSVAVALAVASMVGPPIFHQHLVMAGHPENSPELVHMEQAYRDTSLITVGVALGVALVCATGVSWWLSCRLRAPLGKLTDAARNMTHGRYDTRVPSMGAGAEVETLTTAFNTMATRLERTEDTRRRMLSDLAHEMRTPLSVLTVYTDALSDGVASWDQGTGDVMNEQLLRLTRLVEDIGDVSRAEESQIELDVSTQPVAELLRTAAETHGEAYDAKGVRLVIDGAESAGAVEVDRQRMGQVLSNLLSNALRHTPPGGLVTLRAAAAPPDRVVIQVADTGEGIAPEHLPHVFERFWRADAARDRDHGGSGIGLAIAKAFVAAHGGTLTAASPGAHAGATFTVDLPRRTASASSNFPEKMKETP